MRWTKFGKREWFRNWFDNLPLAEPVSILTDYTFLQIFSCPVSPSDFPHDLSGRRQASMQCIADERRDFLLASLPEELPEKAVKEY
jgi:hypothetical protein